MSSLDEILRNLGWQTGFQIPIANEENRLLEQEVAKLTLRKLQSKTNFEKSTTKLENIESHLKNVNQESDCNQKFIFAYDQQIQSEENNLFSYQAERDGVQKDTKTHQRETKEINERQKVKRTELERNAVKLEKLKAEACWDSEALKAWEESLKKIDKDEELVKKFSKEDERKYNELEAKRQNLQMEYVSRKNLADQTLCSIAEYEKVLERTGKVIKQQMTEKAALMKQWKDTVQILQQRDKLIDQSQKQVTRSRELFDAQKEILKEQNEFLTNEEKNNLALSQEIEQLNTSNSNLRQEFNDLVQELLTLGSDASTIKITLTSVANDLEAKRGKNKFTDKSIKDQKNLKKKLKLELAGLRDKYNDLNYATMTSGERTKHLEQLVSLERKQENILLNEISTIQIKIYRSEQVLYEQRNLIKLKDSEMSSYVNSISHTKKKSREMQREVQKQDEMIYEMDFRIDELQKQMLRSEIVVQDENTQNQREEVKRLENSLYEDTGVKTLLKDQLSRIEDDMRRLTSAIATDDAQLLVLKDKLLNQTMNVEGGQKQMNAAKLHLQEKQVEENVLLLRITNLDNTKRKQEKSIFSLQKSKLKLDAMMMERMLEINAKREVLIAKRRSLDEDRSRMKCDMAARQIKLEQFQKKYSIVLNLFGKDEDGQPLSVTHFKIKNAQEKFMLRKEGDELDAKVKKAEKEIMAMENTLKIVNSTNLIFKENLEAIDDKGDDMEELKALETELYETSDKLRKQRFILSEKIREQKMVEGILKEINDRKTKTEGNLVTLEAEYLFVEREKNLKLERLERAQTLLKNAKSKLKRKKTSKFDRDLEIRQIKDANKAVLQRLAELSVAHVEMAPLIDKYVGENDIELPEIKFTPSTSTDTNRSIESPASSYRSDKSFPTPTSVKSTISRKSTLNSGKLTSNSGNLTKVSTVVVNLEL